MKTSFIESTLKPRDPCLGAQVTDHEESLSLDQVCVRFNFTFLYKYSIFTFFGAIIEYPSTLKDTTVVTRSAVRSQIAYMEITVRSLEI